MTTAKSENSEETLEQKHLDNIMKQIKEREKSLKKSILKQINTLMIVMVFING